MKMKKLTIWIMVLMIISVSGAGVKAYTSQTPMRIDSNDDFSTYATSGNGTLANPWKFTNLEINGSGYGYCIYIGNTTDYFVIEDSYLHNAYTSNPDDYFWTNTGVIFYNVQNGKVDNCTITNNDWYGIYVYDSSDNIIDGNFVCYNACGIYILEGSEDNKVQYNNASSNTYDGITVDYASNNEISRNTADYNEIGFHLYYYASLNTVEDNLAFYNDYGLYIQWADNNTVKENSFCLSTEYGAYIDTESADNEVYHNNFGNNTDQAYDSGTDNVWCAGYPDGGNYWTDYNGYDNYSGINQNINGSDGLGDTPYTSIDGGSSQDAYPLMEIAETYGLGNREDPSGLGSRVDPN